MIEKSNLLRLFSELDQFLSERSAKRELVIYGGAALIAANILERVTFGVDVFQPQLDSLLCEGIKAVGAKYQLGEQWMNSTGRAFVTELPANWQSRVRLLYQGKYLTLKILGRTDLIFTKLLAELDRGEDLRDIVALKPTPEEASLAGSALLGLEDTAAWKAKVRKLVKTFGGTLG